LQGDYKAKREAFCTKAPTKKSRSRRDLPHKPSHQSSLLEASPLGRKQLEEHQELQPLEEVQMNLQCRSEEEV